jgi:TM2 domain-containing membrane protein YozV
MAAPTIAAAAGAYSEREYEAELTRSMNDTQRQLFHAEMLHARKSASTGILLAIFLGGLGVHRFYLKDLWGILYIALMWTFLPMLVGLIEAFLMDRRVATYNKRQAALIAARIRAYTPAVQS